MSNTEDQKILECIAAGDEVVIKDFYKNTWPYIRKYIFDNQGNDEDVADVFQDAMVLIYQKAKAGLELNCSLRTYFYGVCKNIWRNKLRKNKKLIITEAVFDTTETVDPEISRDIENKEREYVYQKHFLNLSDTCRTVLNLLFCGNSMKEISDITGYTEGYTRKKKFECKKHLIEMIESDPVYKELTTKTKKI